ncbi:hypothetical protein B296_00044723 [Ensete ventricosum]|uniref:Uncharacterized protein n=1 Tax=Ensete ventricosum TaxID=4639 RepID=A0A426Y814_ENSVE|nr:hypothetical protein B296_00044723 [Ensete ventricosum]
MSFRSYLKLMCVDQSVTIHVMVSWSLFFIGIFILIVSPFVVSYAHTHRAYDMVV